MRDADTAIGGPRDRFPSTRQSLVTGGGAEALEAVVSVYWKPVYKYVRLKWRRSNEDAKDLVQGFFAAVIEQEIVAHYDPAKAAFRTYLRVCVDRYVMKQDEAATRAKRGGEAIVVDFDAAEREIAMAATRNADGQSMEEYFCREWQRAVFALAVDDLRRLCSETGRETQFRVFAAYDLADEPRPRYEDLAEAQGIAVTTVTNYLAWARRELRQLVRKRTQ